MLSVAKASGAKEGYYATLGKGEEDYYVGSKTHEAGVWLGRGAERVGLGGKAVEPETFRNLFRGFSPDGGEKWVHNAGRMSDGQRDRMPGFDFTFSAPKSVSITRALGSEEMQRAIERAHFEAIRKALEGAEARAIVRSGKGGCVKEQAGLIVGVFQHMTSRQIDERTMPDMQLHSHAVIINTGITASRRTGALSGGEFFFNLIHKDADAVYKAELAKGLIKLGFELRRTADGFEIKGISEAAIEHFSKRTAQIDDKVDRENSTKAERMKAAIETRTPKREVNALELQRYWQQQCLKFGVTKEFIDELARKEKAPSRNAGAEAAREAATELAAEKGVYSARELKERTVETGIARGVSVKEASAAALAYIKSEEVVRIAVESETGTRLYVNRDDPRWENLTESGKAPSEKKDAGKTESQQAGKAAYRRPSAWDAMDERGGRIINCAITKEKVELLNEMGIKAYTMAQIISDLERAAKKESASGKDDLQRRIYANWKHATWQWRGKTRDKYTGDYYRKQPRWKVEWLHATWQISSKHRDYLIREIERKERKLSENTIVILNEPTAVKNNQAVKRLIRLVDKQGGFVFITDAAITSQNEINGRKQEVAFAREAKRQSEQEAEQQERRRTRSM